MGIFHSTANPNHHVLNSHSSSETTASRGKNLLDSFDRARNEHKIKSLGDGENDTIEFCQEVLRVGAIDWANRFIVQKTISCGTTSVVCLAQDTSLNTLVAIKFCKLGTNPDAREFRDRRRQFETEAKYQVRCACPQVTNLFDFRIVHLFAVFIMEYLPRTLLEDIVENNRSPSGSMFPEHRAARHVRSVALALQHCHELSVAHLDVKLDNVLVGKDGVAKLCDFGLAEQTPVCLKKKRKKKN
jgi:serine/threonine protein kinase